MPPAKQQEIATEWRIVSFIPIQWRAIFCRRETAPMDLKRKLKNSELKNDVYKAPSGIHGTGLFARRDIEKGEYIGTYHGPVAQRNGTYVLWVYETDDMESPVGRSGRNLLRYLNHAKPGRGEFDGFDFYARMNIEAGEEITFDYDGA